MTYRKFSLVEPPFPNLFIVFRNLWTLVHFSRTPSFVFSSLWTLCTKIPGRGIPPQYPIFYQVFLESCAHSFSSQAICFQFVVES